MATDRPTLRSAVRKIFSRRPMSSETPSPLPDAPAPRSGATPDPMLAAWFERVRSCEERGEAAAAGDATARRLHSHMSEDAMEVSSCVHTQSLHIPPAPAPVATDATGAGQAMLRGWLAKRDIHATEAAPHATGFRTSAGGCLSAD